MHHVQILLSVWNKIELTAQQILRANAYKACAHHALDLGGKLNTGEPARPLPPRACMGLSRNGV